VALSRAEIYLRDREGRKDRSVSSAACRPLERKEEEEEEEEEAEEGPFMLFHSADS
jgi:hypothetical protein